MDLTATLTEIASLPVDERLRLVEAIWETNTAEPGQPALTENQRLELERRWVAHAESPEAVVSWEEVRAQALARARR